MPDWSALDAAFAAAKVDTQSQFIQDESRKAIRRIEALYDRNVLFYASAFLQKPTAPSSLTGISEEDINAFVSGVHGVDPEKGLLLLLHTPGGLLTAVHTIVEYLRSKFEKIDAVVPTYAMSAGTMIALGCDRIVMGHQSQLGPTDPQLFSTDRYWSAHAIVQQFAMAKADIVKNPATAPAWEPILRSYRPALLLEAQRTLDYCDIIVRQWLESYMFSGDENAATKAREVASYFSSAKHGVHGKRIGRDAARDQGVKVNNLERNQEREDAVLTLYHLVTIAFQYGPAAKCLMSSNGTTWIRNFQQHPG